MDKTVARNILEQVLIARVEFVGPPEAAQIVDAIELYVNSLIEARLHGTNVDMGRLIGS